jgi:hypothetical protein
VNNGGYTNGGVPIIYGDKRPYTSSSTHSTSNSHAKRSTATQKQSSAIAALYLGSQVKQQMNNTQQNIMASVIKNGQLYSNIAELNSLVAQGLTTTNSSMMMTTPYQPPKKRMF